MAQHLAGGATAQHVGVADAVPTRQHRVTRDNSLRPGRYAPARPPQVDQRIGGLLDAQPLGQRGRQQQARTGHRMGVVKQLSSWSRVWQDPIENLPS
ncbi:MAG TPA: hypothetical protein VHW42_08045 [Actinomycetes bacterium]|nr:hypothetical protein [Actinomycetes bacterium]